MSNQRFLIVVSYQTLDRNTKLTARNGRTVDALVVFSHSIRYLKDRAIEIIRERTGDDRYSAKDTQWVITVPAIWKPAAKQFMREAAYKVNYCCFVLLRHDIVWLKHELRWLATVSSPIQQLYLDGSILQLFTS